MSNWTQAEISHIVENQRAFFRTGKTLDVGFRLEQLKKIRNMVLRHETEICAALHTDLGRGDTEAFFCDIGTVVAECNETIRGLRRWARPEKHFSGLMCFPSLTTTVYKMPYGVALIISPFNFPFLLSLGVLIAAIAGGNTAVIKASSKSPACTQVLAELVKQNFPENYVAVVDGGHEAADLCLSERFDKIFYTGSPNIGKHVLEMAAKNLTPAALELGGETGNWCIIRADANLKDAARKIAFFKICNSGQVCININQVAVADSVADAFVKELKEAISHQLQAARSSGSYARLINRQAYEKCAQEAEFYRNRIVCGGQGDPDTCHFEPTVIYPVDITENIVQHELFSPLLSVVPFRDDRVEDLLHTIAEREHGLALYLFTRDIRWAKRVMASQQYGGGCINEVCLHMMVKGVPFNGTGHSGMGAYHGEWGFREFTHPSTVLRGSTHFNLSLREHPYTELKAKLIKLFER